MVIIGKRLLDLTAADLMSIDVVTIPEPMSLRAAAHRLALAGVTGAPVVDAEGRCVGVISSMDLVRFLDQGARAARPICPGPTCYCSDWQVADLDMLPADAVSHYMTTEVVRVSAHAGIGELARTMLDAHIHRVIIVDVQGRPIGVVSSTDVLAAVAAEDRRDSGLSLE
jgi:CBS-domain-containing membrane protein